MMNDHEISNGNRENDENLKPKKLCRKWEKKCVRNEGKEDLKLFHWRLVEPLDISVASPYNFADSSSIKYPPYIDDDLYNRYFKCEGWDQEKTNYFLRLCRDFELNFYVVQDRLLTEYENPKFDVLDLRKRYSDICQIYNNISCCDLKLTNIKINYQQERKRRFLIELYHSQTKYDFLKELYLDNQLEKIIYKQEIKALEELAREFDEKSSSMYGEMNDFQPSEHSRENISIRNIENGFHQTSNVRTSHSILSQKKIRLPQKKVLPPEKQPHFSNPTQKIFSTYNRIYQMYKFPDLKCVGASLRSQRHKIPQNVGSRRIKALNHALVQMNYIITPPATVEICEKFSILRSNLIALYDLKHAIMCFELEYQKAKQKYVTMMPDTPLPFKEEEIKPFQVTFIDDPPIKPATENT